MLALRRAYTFANGATMNFQPVVDLIVRAFEMSFDCWVGEEFTFMMGTDLVSQRVDFFKLDCQYSAFGLFAGSVVMAMDYFVADIPHFHPLCPN